MIDLLEEFDVFLPEGYEDFEGVLDSDEKDYLKGFVHGCSDCLRALDNLQGDNWIIPFLEQHEEELESVKDSIKEFLECQISEVILSLMDNHAEEG